MLANRDKKHDLIHHCRGVGVLARAMAEYLGMEVKLCEHSFYAGCFHDIGKAHPDFQKYLAGTSEGEQDPSHPYPMHHEISWAYVASKTGCVDILQAVYWHHGRPMGEKGEVFKDRDEILSLVGSCDDLELVWQELSAGMQGVTPSDPCVVPDMFVRDGDGNKKTNSERLLIRACVVSADRYISRHLSASEVKDLSEGKLDPASLIGKMVSGGVSGTPSCPAGYDVMRYGVQLKCAETAKDARTTVVRAPAGLGKTVVGVLWGLKRGRRMVWVCPRNVVARAVYKNIVKEVESLGLSCTVELFLTGKREECNFVTSVVDDETEEFSADIVVTNIDNILSPMVNNRVGDRLFLTFGADVVLDEFHEFASDAPLFAALVIYMRARHRVASECHTLLLSATPSVLHKLWDTVDRPSLFLPDGLSHYAPVHDKPYSFSFDTSMPAVPSAGMLSVSNAVSKAQEEYAKGYTRVLHHAFTEKDRKGIEDDLYAWFGKGGTGTQDGRSFSAALVVQAAMDVSFRSLCDALCSPEFTLQRIGRLNRWGEAEQATVSFVEWDMKVERSESSAVDTVYKKELRSLWVDHLRGALAGKTEFTLSELYEVYNSFYARHGAAVFEHIKKMYKIGLEGTPKHPALGLISYCPIHRPEGTEKSKGRSLRSPTGTYYYSVRVEGAKEWLGVDDVLSEGFELYHRYMKDGTLTAGLLNGSKMLHHLKSLVSAGFVSYAKYVKKGHAPDNIERWFRLARDFETPLPDFSRTYSHEVGLIK